MLSRRQLQGLVRPRLAMAPLKAVQDSLHDEAAGDASRYNRRNLAPLDEI